MCVVAVCAPIVLKLMDIRNEDYRGGGGCDQEGVAHRASSAFPAAILHLALLIISAATEDRDTRE